MIIYKPVLRLFKLARFCPTVLKLSFKPTENAMLNQCFDQVQGLYIIVPMRQIVDNAVLHRFLIDRET